MFMYIRFIDTFSLIQTYRHLSISDEKIAQIQEELPKTVN